MTDDFKLIDSAENIETANNDEAFSFEEIEQLKVKEIALERVSKAINNLYTEQGTEEFFILLRKITKAQGGMSRLSKLTGINRQNLYRTFTVNRNPKLKNLAKILKGLGFKLNIEESAITVSNKDQEAA